MNRGKFARTLADRWQCRVFGLEPVPELVHDLRKQGLHVMNKALAGEDGPVDLHMSTNLLASSVVAGFVDDAAAVGQLRSPIPKRCVTRISFGGVSPPAGFPFMSLTIGEASAFTGMGSSPCHPAAYGAIRASTLAGVYTWRMIIRSSWNRVDHDSEQPYWTENAIQVDPSASTASMTTLLYLPPG